jgi:hypothetical protein
MQRFSIRWICLFAIALAAPAFGWDAHGHRIIAQLAVESMGPEAPDWLKDASVAQIADEATVPDRWRSTHLAQLTHLNNPDHYIDTEDLAPYGLTLKTLPPLRYEYVKAMVLARERAGDKFEGRPVNAARDTAKTEEWPGFAPYAILENYGKLQSAFSTVRILEKVNDPARAPQLEMARENAKVVMGIMAHYVGDCAQPLHTTKHHHGWVGDNPKGYTTDSKFHAYIDGGVLRLHHIDAAMVRPLCKFDAKLDAREPWDDVIAYIGVTFQTVEPLYELQKSGDLDKEPGKQFICERLAAGASMLGELYKAAWDSAAPQDKDIQEFERYDSFEAAAKKASSAKAKATPVAAVWYEISYPAPDVKETEKLIAGLWSDGTVVWSDNRDTGGKPYHTARISDDDVNKLLSDLSTAGLFEKLDQVHFGPDASHTVIAAKIGGKTQWLGSWHEPARPGMVATEAGLMATPKVRKRPKPRRNTSTFSMSGPARGS